MLYGDIYTSLRATVPPPRLFPPTTTSRAVKYHDSPPKEVILSNEKSLTEHGYSKMKTTAVQGIKLMIEVATEQSKEDIGNAIKNAKSVALKDINNEYDAILKYLRNYDTTKEDLENETDIAIEAMNAAKLT